MKARMFWVSSRKLGADVTLLRLERWRGWRCESGVDDSPWRLVNVTCSRSLNHKVDTERYVDNRL